MNQGGQMDSLPVILLQALHNDDSQLLEYCLEREVNNMKFNHLIEHRKRIL